MKLEVCANSFESALAAQKGGADRIELCQELSLGGITPSHGLIEKVVEELDIPVFALIRPRSGDFTYTKEEIDVMLRDIAFAKNLGVQGIVSGVLHPDFTINEEITEQLIKASGELPFVFHRAFDWTPNSEEALKTLVDLGVVRVLTSGQAQNAIAGFDLLKKLLDSSQDKIGILPGGGITIDTVMQFKNAGFAEVHGSLSRTFKGLSHTINMSEVSAVNEGFLKVSDEEVIRKFVNKIQ